MSTIELHSWNATTADLNLPDRFVLDLDPDPALPWKSMVEATQLTLTVLDELGLRAFSQNQRRQGNTSGCPAHAWRLLGGRQGVQPSHRQIYGQAYPGEVRSGARAQESGRQDLH
jgi:hypothetical protein